MNLLLRVHMRMWMCVDLTLIMADGGGHGVADPAFAAHQAPITMWAEAVWCSWLPREALQALAGYALQRILGIESPWSRVAGPATAFVASARRLGWVVRDAVQVLTDRGLHVDFRRDSPAFVRNQVSESVRRWRWQNVESRIPSLIRGVGGFGAHLQPIFRLLQGKQSEQWGPSQKGALRSTLSNRQWTQCRLHSAGLASTKNCWLCVQLGFCSADDPDPVHRGTMLHRIWLCPATESARKDMVPSWLYSEVKRAIRPDSTMAPSDLALYTRALVASPAASLEPPPKDDTFEWVQRPADGIVSGKIYVDGSRLDGEWRLAGMCARLGWAFAAYDDNGYLCAAARGRPPAWVGGIHGAELWGLSMAISSADPWAPIRVDCLSVQQGSQKGLEWAGAPDRHLARIWAPLNAALDDNPSRVAWMPAHCGLDGIGVKKLGNGELLTALDHAGNAYVDQLAKEAARADRLAPARRAEVHKLWETLTAVATWIGQVTVLANHFPDPDWTDSCRRRFLRDSEGSTNRTASGTSRQQPGQQQQLDAVAPRSDGAPRPCKRARNSTDALTDQRWEALRRRVCAKSWASEGASRADNLVKLEATHPPLVEAPCIVKRRRKQRTPCMKQQVLGVRASSPMRQPTCVKDSLNANPAAGPAPGPAVEPNNEGTALAALKELEGSGAKICWPRCSLACSRVESKPSSSDGRPAAPTRTLQYGQQQSSEEQAARAELAELARAGLRVSWL